MYIDTEETPKLLNKGSSPNVDPNDRVNSEEVCGK